MPNVRWTKESVVELLHRFVGETDELSEKAWRQWTASSGGPASGSVARHFDGQAVSLILHEFALEHAPRDRSFTWSSCPRGTRHQLEPRWAGSIAERELGECQSCVLAAERRAEQRAERQKHDGETDDRNRMMLEALPPLGVRFPHLLDCLADPADADRHIDKVSVLCGVCREPIPRLLDLRQRPDEVPICKRYCARTHGQPPGSIIRADGGGDRVRIEEDLAAALLERGIAASHEIGIVTPRGSYIVAVIKPDVVVLDPPVAIEVDLDRKPNRHLTPEGVADDQARDLILNELGWSVLRIRPPGAPSEGDWPWSIEARSSSLPGLTEGVVKRLKQRAAGLGIIATEEGTSC